MNSAQLKRGMTLLTIPQNFDMRLSADDQGSGISSMMQDLAFAIPGVDEAMGFAEVMK